MTKDRVAIFIDACGLSEDLARGKEFLREALEYSRSTPEDPVASALLQLLHRRVRIPGFRFFDLAKLDMQVQALMPIRKLSAPICEEIITVWSMAHKDILSEATRHFDALLIDEYEVLQNKIIQDEGHDELKNILGEFLNEHTEFDTWKCLAAFYFLLLFAEREGSEEPLTEGIQADDQSKRISEESCETLTLLEFWSTLLQKVEGLSAESSEWNQLPFFIEKLEAIKEKKMIEGALIGVRRRIDELLNQTRMLLSDYPDHDCVAELLSWSTDRIPESQLDVVSSQLESFHEAVLRCRDLQNELRNNLFNIVAASALADAVREVESHLKELSGIFSSTAAPELESPPDGGVAGEEKEAATALEDSQSPETIIEEPVSPEPAQGSEAVSVIPEEMSAIIEEGVGGKEASLEESSPVTVPHGVDFETSGDSEAILPASSQPEEQKDVKDEELPGTETINETYWKDFLAHLIIEDDLPGAYWLARSLEQLGVRDAMPPWLIEALLGSRLLDWENEAFSGDLLDISKNHIPNNNDINRTFGLATALKPALISPTSGMATWLTEPDSLHEIHGIVMALREFAQRQYPLKHQDLSGIEDKEIRRRSIEAIVREARDFLEEMRKRTLERKSTTKVWTSFISTDGPMANLLSPVAVDARGEAENVASLLSDWRSDEYIATQIEKALAKQHLRSTRQIGTGPREQIHQNVREATSIAEKWLSLIRREALIENRGTWLLEQVKSLKDRVEASLPSVFSALQDMAAESQPAERRAAAFSLGCSLIQLAGMLNIEIDPALSERYKTRVELWMLGIGETLRATLCSRLIWLPELSPQDDLSLVANELERLPQLLKLAHDNGRTLYDAIEAWIESKDFRFVENALKRLNEDKGTNALRQRFRDDLRGSRLALQEQFDDALEQIEQAVVDGILLDEDRAEMLGRIHHIQPSRELNIGFRHNEIKRGIYDRLARARKDRLNYLRKVWEELSVKLTSIVPHAKTVDSVSSFISTAFDGGEIRVLGESLAHLLEVVDVGKEIDEAIFKSRERVSCETLGDFMSKLPEIESFLAQHNRLQGIMRAIRGKETVFSMQYARLPKERLESAFEGVNSFYELGKSHQDQAKAVQSARGILSFLGYRPSNGERIRTDIKYKGADVLYLRASVTAANLARPISEFGSLVEGALNVLVLWERPVAETITSRIEELKLDREGLVVFFLGRLSQDQRWGVLKLSRSQNTALAILDETLLVYLTGERGERLSAFLKTALPFTVVNPYKPFVQGDVPSEMFYGRKRMADDLQEYNTCLVYGGRQLGKSALLRHVQRVFHNPSLERYALYIDIKNVGAASSRDAKRYQEEIWERVRDGLKDLGLIRASVHTYKADTLTKHIQECLQERPDRRILVLFDEADNFLDADAESKDFPVLQEFKTIMSDTKRRFKVVFAGLQNVQRFQGIPNQPLAQFGVPLKVGPLEPSDAAQLVWEPMEYLGIELNETSILRILSYTNYHAGLIQFFCRKLVERIAKKQRSGRITLPVKVQREDVEAVYREQAVRDEIRQRLDLTLELDTRYQAIAWALILEQKSDRDSYSRSFSAKDVLDLVRDYWSAGFADTEIDDMSSKLDEMCALGVLVRNSDGFYRLRSPNIVALMGPDIGTRLEELAQKEPEERFRPDAHHTPLDVNCRVYSPLTYSQERDLTPPDSGVSIVFASPALGLARIPEALSALIPQGYIKEGIGEVKKIPSAVKKAEVLNELISTTLKDCPKAEQILFTFKPQGGAETLKYLATEALDICTRHKSRTRKRWFKIIFVLDAQTAENWLLFDFEEREGIENKCDAVLSPKLWNDDGIRNRLDHLDKLTAPEVCMAIMEATGGWPYLLDHFFETFEHESNLTSPAKVLNRELSEPGSKLRGSFLNAISLCGLPGTPEVFSVLLEMGTVHESDLPDLHQLIEPGSGKALTHDDVLRVIEYFRRFRILRSIGSHVQLDETIKRLYGTS